MDMAPAGVHKRRWSAGPTARREGPWLVGCWLVCWFEAVALSGYTWLGRHGCRRICCSRAVKI